MVRPGVEVVTPRDRAAWLKLRRRDVTASVVGALFGEHEYVSAFELWAHKTGRIAKGDEESPALRRGRLLEPVAVQILREDHPDWQIEYSTSEQTYFRDPAHRLGATPDVIVTCPRRGRGIVQIKTVDAGVFRRKWHPDGRDGATEPPFWIVLQSVLEAWLTGGQWAAVAPLVVGHGLELPLIDVPLDHMPEVVGAMQERAADFWKMVEEDREPQPDYGRDGAIIEAIYAAGDDQEEIDLTADAEVEELVRDIRAWRSQVNYLVRDVEAAEARLKARMGRAEVAHMIGGRKITWRTHRRPNPGGLPTIYRVLRLPKD
jgi:hypothetical protein